ncbi:helix-turn-helix transcriptional regulator [Methanospirillum lacunae]|uniref:Transcriptional regulator n=1 Tax=Methanospirillum lacunae TaxID=668570 RepID=A0A2V2N4J2_9EURY|nr:helix-turn-helix transcriptional regulator [Methanospirillum lacunae]PWR74739.1 transcriptional regulator [Methanospirillum lacunae]
MKNRIKVLRAEYDMTQETLAQLVGVTRNTIISIEKGKYYPSLLIGYRMARVFDVDINDIFTYEEGIDDLQSE